MKNDTLIPIVLIGAGAITFAVWVWLIVIPACKSYDTIWQRVVATVLSVYILATFLLLGGGVAGVALYYYDQV